ncbi:hypothetical protein ACFL5X_03155 [Candidatus Omnitrophota bacterium]
MKTLKILVIFGLFIIVAQCSFAQTTAAIGVNAVVDPQFELTYWMREAPPGAYPEDGSDADSIVFDNLQWDPTNHIWTASRYYTVFMIATTAGQPYEIEQTCVGLTRVGGGGDLNDSFIVTPGYEILDRWDGDDPLTAQGAMPGGDNYGTPGLAVTTNKLLYDGNSGLARIARAYYGLSTGEPGTPGSPVTGDQLSGTYTGNVIITLVQR